MSKRLLFLLIIPLLFVIASPVVAQQYNIKTYTTKNGLANSNVNHIYLDKRGYLWMSTQGGISRFDGKFFKNYTSHDGLPGNDITSIGEDRSGNIWITTNNFGVSKFDGLHFTNYTVKDGLGSDVVYAVYADEGNNVWFATLGGISCFSPIRQQGEKPFHTYTVRDGLPANEYYAIAPDKAHNIWFGSRKKGLCKFDGKHFLSYPFADAAHESNVFSLLCDAAGKLWIGTTNEGVCVLEGGKIIPGGIEKLKSSFISSIKQDSHQAIWFGSDIGLYKYCEEKPGSLFSEKNGLPSANIGSLATDYEGNIWIGSGLGVCQFKNEAIVTFSEKEGLANNKVISFLQDRNGESLVSCSGDGLRSFDGKKFSALPLKELKGTNVQCMFQDSHHHIWLGFESNSASSLVALEKKKDKYSVLKNYKGLCGKPVSTVSKIVEDHAGNIWIASYGHGLFRIQGENVEAFGSPSDSIPLNILTLFIDHAGCLWIGSAQEGLLKYDGKKIDHLSKKDGLADNTIWSITEDKEGNLFLGTAENGISVYNRKTFTTLSAREGLASNLVYALCFDAKNRLWAGTDKGINKLLLSATFAIDSIKYYGEEDGLMGTEISQNGFVHDASGKLWICTTNGLTRYDATMDYINNTPPRVILNGIRLFYQEMDWTKYADHIDPVTKLPSNLSLRYKENHLTFDYQALTTANVHYQFKLDGLDADWSPLTTNTQAVYTNIPAADNYTFMVKAINADGYWSANIVSFSFRITPPFWKTWWFYTLSILLIVGSVVFFISRRTAKLEQEKKILEERVEERTIELKGANDQLSHAFKDIKDSINYAKRIQQAILPLETEIQKALPRHFIYFRPRDVVSGDFYWFNKKNDRIYLAACDCTGHGVPGAFMSIIGNSLLNEIAHEPSISEPAHILNELRDKIITALKQRSGEQESKDGMDMMLCCIDKTTNKLTFAGANNPLYIIRKGELNEFKGNKQPIGVYGDELKPFTNQLFDLEPGDQVYLFSDGYPDQFGGPRGKKFLYTRFKELLVSISSKTMEEQSAELDKAFQTWKADQEQVDDVLVIGIRV